MGQFDVIKRTVPETDRCKQFSKDACSGLGRPTCLMVHCPLAPNEGKIPIAPMSPLTDTDDV